MDADAAVHEMIGRARTAGEACGLYDLAASVVDGPAEPLRIVMQFGVGERAWRDNRNTAREAQERSLRQMEVGLDRMEGEEQLRRASEGALGDLERGGA